MSVEITCTECGEDVGFSIEGKETRPQAICDGCGQTYELRVRKVFT